LSLPDPLSKEVFKVTYTVKAGDTLSEIASRNGTTLVALLQLNSQIKDPNKIEVGDEITLPGESGETVVPTDDSKPAPVPVPTTPVPTTSSPGALGTALAEALGTLSAKYETGGRGPGTVSSGAGDPGGVSYGSYQMATKMGTATKFVTQAGFRWAANFQNLNAGTPDFTAMWKKIAAQEPETFQDAQHTYIKKTHYDLLATKILTDDSLDVNTRSRAVQDVVWSTAVQHGGATPIVHRACANLSCAQTDPKYDELLIRAIYAERGRKKPDGNLAYFSKSSPNVQAGVSNRFKNELQDALAMLAKEV
jgi:murein DD-endopeptidase MepM/ murein hydrolase activator NlpD